MNLSAVRVFVKDVAEAKVFYAERLGLRLTHADLEPGVCILDEGGAQLIVEAVPAGAPADEQVLVGRFTGLSFAVDDVEDATALYQEYVASGARVRHPPRNYPWALEIHIQDPDGHILRFASEPLNRPFDPWAD